MIKRLHTWLHRLEDAVLVTLLLSMIVLAGADILARSLFGGGISWIPPLLRVMVLWVGLLGALLATRSGEHISVDLINRLAGEQVKRWLQRLTSLFAAIICAILGWHSVEFVQGTHEYGDIAFANLPAWPMQVIIPISFLLMALRFLLQTVFPPVSEAQASS